MNNKEFLKVCILQKNRLVRTMKGPLIFLLNERKKDREMFEEEQRWET